MKKIFLSLLAAILYICSVGVSQAQVTVSGVLQESKRTTTATSHGLFTGTVTLTSVADETKTYTGEVSIQNDPNDTKIPKKSVFSISNVDAGDYYVSANCKKATESWKWFRLYLEPNYIITVKADEDYKLASTGTSSPKADSGRITSYGGDGTFILTGTNDEGEVIPLSGYDIYYRDLSDVTMTAPIKKTTDAEGKVIFQLYEGHKHWFHTEKTEIYKDTTLETNFAYGAIKEVYNFPLHKRIFYNGPTSKVSGNVTIDGRTVTTLPEGLSLRLTPIALEKVDGEEWEDLDCDPITTTVADGKFEFTGVPRAKRATFQVHEDAAISNGQLSYEYRIASPKDTITLTDAETVTRDIAIERFASVVKGDITGFPESGVYSGYVYLVAPKTAAAEGEPEFDTVQTFSFTCPNQATKASYNFRSVLPGNYILQIFCYQGYGLDTEIAPLTVTLEQDVTVPEIKMVPAETVVRFSPAAGSLNGIYNKYLGETVSLMDGAKLILWNKDKTKKLDSTITNTDGFYLKTVCMLGDEFVVTISREDIYPAETTVTVTSMSLSNNFSFEGKIRFVPVAHAALELKAVWNDATKATLTWEWPEAEKMEDLVIAKIELRRRVKTSNEWTAVKTWETPAMDALPTTFNDTEVAKGNQYVYECKITYSTPQDVKATTCEMDARFRYKLEFSVNDEKMGSITGGQPGNYLENTQIELTALPNPNYEFVAWKSGDDTVAKTATILFNISQDTNLVAIFKNKSFKITVLSDNSEWGTVEGEGSFEFGTEVTVTATPAKGCKFVAWKENTVEVSKEAVYKFTVEKDRTLIAVFEEEVANEDLEASRWTIFAENGTLVINGLDGDRYTVYDLNGRLAGQALCTGTEIRMTVNPNQLYIVRRVSAQGAFGFKKIVVR